MGCRAIGWMDGYKWSQAERGPRAASLITLAGYGRGVRRV
jgi:hypothetical protein